GPAPAHPGAAPRTAGTAGGVVLAPAAALAAATGPVVAPRPGSRPTPARMRLVAVGLVVVGLLVGLAGGASFAAADAATDRADANAAQLVRLQELQTRLVSADASATNAFLVGGLEPADRRAVYDDAMAAATRLVAEAARAQPADGTVLAALNTAVLDYAADIEQARAANRQALPVGAQYLRNASAALRADALPALAALIDANQERVAAEFSAARSAWVLAVLASLLGLGAVVAASVWLARRTHRYVNLPLAGAGLVLLVLLVGSAVTLGSVAAEVDRVRTGPFAAATALSEARLAAFDAKSNESLTLISRGSGQAFEEAWVASSDVVDRGLAEAAGTGSVADLRTDWDAYATLHADLRALDDGGAWDDAVAAATSTEPGTADAAFASFDATLGAALAAASGEASDALADARGGLLVGAALAALAGLAVAVLSWNGISRRIEEYR
uniref:hypothetical protein n=1 Tax=Actinotalea solisilvae TaxID=2072922 RepID=UPI0018F24ACA